MTTLRVWEKRHAAFAPAKSGGRHRLYKDADVIKARLLRQLTAAGHSIGTIGPLALDNLQQMLARARGADAPPPVDPPRVTVAVVGEAVAARLNSPHWRATYFGRALDVQRVFADLDAIQVEPTGAPGESGPDILLARFNTLRVGAVEQLTRAVAQLRAPHVIVLFVYGAQATVDALRAAGMIVRREPVSEADLAELIRSQILVDTAGSIAAVRGAALIPPRRFTDVMLAQIAGRPANMLCECPRHIAELVSQLASFEEYSRDCLNRSDQDAQMHAYLRSVAGSARALFERALETVALHDGLDLQGEPPA